MSCKLPLVKALFWLLAILVPAQPVLALDCPCSCRAIQKSDCDEQKTDARGCTHCSGCCKTGRESTGKCKTDENRQSVEISAARFSGRTSSISIGIHPCQCADDCACKVQHEVRVGVIESKQSPIDFNCDLIGTELVESLLGIDLLLTCPGSPLARQDSDSGYSALEICAHLCRFTI